jgi:hypothetical protein
MAQQFWTFLMLQEELSCSFDANAIAWRVNLMVPLLASALHVFCSDPSSICLRESCLLCWSPTIFLANLKSFALLGPQNSSPRNMNALWLIGLSNFRDIKRWTRRFLDQTA